MSKERLGLNRNTQVALLRAISLRADVIVHLEDDTVPSPDALRYFDWAVRETLIPDGRSLYLGRRPRLGVFATRKSLLRRQLMAGRMM